MKGVQIFRHSLYQVIGNLEGALRVSALPYLAQVLLSYTLLSQADILSLEVGLDADPGALDPSVPLRFTGVGLVSLVVSLWITVAWHRYILLNELPHGVVPAFRGAQIWAYFLRVLGYGLILSLLYILLAMVAQIFLGLEVVGVLLSTLIVMVPLVVVGFRLSSALPGVAIDAPHGFLAGWAATAEQTGDIALVALIAVGANLLLNAIGMALFSGLPIFGFVWDVAAGWFVTMVGASILTTLYGHYIEGRALRG
ncbi:hypothetical protein [Pseudogemmobacter sonorensis]|uniref:hypothetical protein n=1 Tax=Pseudogemmobacter sonorensis TaxID=2989681 RepID=UPI0036C91115